MKGIEQSMMCRAGRGTAFTLIWLTMVVAKNASADSQ